MLSVLAPLDIHSRGGQCIHRITYNNIHTYIHTPKRTDDGVPLVQLDAGGAEARVVGEAPRPDDRVGHALRLLVFGGWDGVGKTKGKA